MHGIALVTVLGLAAAGIRFSNAGDGDKAVVPRHFGRVTSFRLSDYPGNPPHMAVVVGGIWIETKSPVLISAVSELFHNGCTATFWYDVVPVNTAIVNRLRQIEVDGPGMAHYGGAVTGCPSFEQP
jgi:hypothetical protein